MGTEAKAKVAPRVVKLDKALKLVESWVNNMSASATGESNERDFEGRPSRLGLGAKVTPHAKVAASTDPVERKLLGKVNAKKRQASRNLEKTNTAEDSGPSEEDNDEPESRTNAFAKKRAMPPAMSLQSTKKSK
ncbi:uncharacterized protein LOC103717166 [Phoenix dactylifera]|uniref:Uncharacterized protein LOC103717166 n=1 Tax=Phoenix dactylifera TaxID=42345 RepID=A0A8B7CPR4_PHODC|nr:uncharacterized protein LOC103717166 [Phoenix dactylifera]